MALKSQQGFLRQPQLANSPFDMGMLSCRHYTIFPCIGRGSLESECAGLEVVRDLKLEFVVVDQRQVDPFLEDLGAELVGYLSRSQDAVDLPTSKYRECEIIVEFP